MADSPPSIEFFEGVSEELSLVSLRHNKSTGVRNVLMTFEDLKALDRFNSFTKRSSNNLRLIDSEGLISVSPSSVQLVFGGEDGDELKRVECIFEVELEDHWERFMRFMQRYSEAHGMAYSATKKATAALI